MEAIKVLTKILTNILTALYEPFGFSLLLSFLAMFFYLYAYESSDICTWDTHPMDKFFADVQI